jgi:hypothetical protein
MEVVMTDKERLRRALRGDSLCLNITNDWDRIFAEVDSFVAQSQGNDTIQNLHLYPYDIHSGNYELWDKVGQGVGNLKSLGVLRIHLLRMSLGEPDWEVLARILPHVQSKIGLRFLLGEMREIQAFARAIQGCSAITRFDTSVGGGLSFENTATLCSALTTLPNLEFASLRQQRTESTFRSPDAFDLCSNTQSLSLLQSMTEFLRAPSLRIVKFRDFCLTISLCQATAMALRQGSSITSLNLHECSFPEGGSEQIASALQENTTLTTFEITPSCDGIHEAFYDALAASLRSNSALQELSIRYLGTTSPTSVCVSSLLLALGMNKTLRKLHLSGLSSVGGSMIPALREGLGKNSTLEILELIPGTFRGEALVTEPSFRISVVKALQLNKSLKTLRIRGGTQNLTDDEAKHLTSVVKENYGLKSLPFLDSSDVRMGDLRSILRLNGAGRGYLLDGHGSVLSKGVGVFSAVNDDLNCVFLHLLENPSLCNRSH